MNIKPTRENPIKSQELCNGFITGPAHNRNLSDNHQNLNLIKISQKQPEFHPYNIPPDIRIIMKMK